MEISPEKSEMMAFLRQDPVRCKIIVNNKCLPQVNNFKYLGCEIFFQNEKDTQQKLAKFAQILGILNNICKPTLVQKFAGITVYNALVLPILLYEREIWNLRKKDKKRLTSIEIKFFRPPPFLTTKEMRKFWKS